MVNSILHTESGKLIEFNLAEMIYKSYLRQISFYSLQGKSSGIHLLNFALKTWRVLDSAPYLTDLTLPPLRNLFPPRS